MGINLFRRARIASEAFIDIANWREVLPRASAGEIVTEIQLRDGTVIRGSPENALWPEFSNIWYHRAYTKHCKIPKGAVVIDVGANVGTFSIFAARTGGVVYSLEPASANFSYLISNVRRAGNIVPLNLACAAQSGPVTLDLTANPVSFSIKTTAIGGKRETVTAITLSELFDRYKINGCDFLKLDCEGCEFDIILESEAVLFERISRIVMEYHDHLSKDFSHHDLLQRLKSLGFRTVSYGRNGSCGMIAAIRREDF